MTKRAYQRIPSLMQKIQNWRTNLDLHLGGNCLTDLYTRKTHLLSLEPEGQDHAPPCGGERRCRYADGDD